MRNENSVNILDILNNKISAAKAEFSNKEVQSLADNEAFVEVLAKQQLKSEGIDTLKTLLGQVDTLTEAKSRLFGFGEAVDLIVQLSSAWLYSKAETKPLIEAIVPSLPQYSEDLLLSMGKLPYYSKTLDAVIIGEPMNVLTFKALISALAHDLAIYVDTGQINNTHAEALYKKANLKAELAFKEAANTAALKSNALEL